MKVLILAGGRGTRLWPLSRKAKPKQFQKLMSHHTMLQETVNRLLPQFRWHDIFISTNQWYKEEVEVELPKLPKENIITEPVARERVAAIALFMVRFSEEELREPVLILPSDHLIKNGEGFLQAISTAQKFSARNTQYITTLGAKPTFPDTGLGYVQRGQLLAGSNHSSVYEAIRFVEKPNLNRAQSYLDSGDYFWNMAIYIFIPSLMEDQIKKFIPDVYKRYKYLKQAWGTSEFNKVLKKEYREMDSASIEYSILENYSKRALVPTDLGWSDIGSWSSLKDSLSEPGQNFVKGNHIGVDSENVMVYGANDRLIATVGVKDLVVVSCDDITLICHKNNSQQVKELVNKLKKEKKLNGYI